MEARFDVIEAMLALVSLSLISAMIDCASDNPCAIIMFLVADSPRA